MKKFLIAPMIVVASFAMTLTLTGCSSGEPTVIEDAPMSEQEMTDYEAEMDATEPIEK